jgi:hypothetical protein
MGVILLGAGIWALGWIFGVARWRRFMVLAAIWALALIAHLSLPAGPCAAAAFWR